MAPHLLQTPAFLKFLWPHPALLHSHWSVTATVGAATPLAWIVPTVSLVDSCCFKRAKKVLASSSWMEELFSVVADCGAVPGSTVAFETTWCRSSLSVLAGRVGEYELLRQEAFLLFFAFLSFLLFLCFFRVSCCERLLDPDASDEYPRRLPRGEADALRDFLPRMRE
jgi:hypothetical protein